MHRLEKIADGIFIIAMIGMVIDLCVDYLHAFLFRPDQALAKGPL